MSRGSRLWFVAAVLLLVTIAVACGVAKVDTGSSPATGGPDGSKNPFGNVARSAPDDIRASVIQFWSGMHAGTSTVGGFFSPRCRDRLGTELGPTLARYEAMNLNAMTLKSFVANVAGDDRSAAVTYEWDGIPPQVTGERWVRGPDRAWLFDDCERLLRVSTPGSTGTTAATRP